MTTGKHVLVDCDTRRCGVVSGTSYSVSYVAGAAEPVPAGWNRRAAAALETKTIFLPIVRAA